MYVHTLRKKTSLTLLGGLVDCLCKIRCRWLMGCDVWLKLSSKLFAQSVVEGKDEAK